MEDSSVEDQETTLREATGASKTLTDDLVEVHGQGNYVSQNLINLNKRVEDSSVKDQDISLRESSGASKTLNDDLVEVHEKGNYVSQNLINLNIVRLNVEEVNQQIPQPPREWRIFQ